MCHNPLRHLTTFRYSGKSLDKFLTYIRISYGVLLGAALSSAKLTQVAQGLIMLYRRG